MGSFNLKLASPKNQISKYKITEPSLILFIYKYENLVPWKSIGSKEDLVAYIRNTMLSQLYSQIDPSSEENNYLKDIDLEREFEVHANDPEVQQARQIYQQDPEKAKQVILERVNQEKQIIFTDWKEYLTEVNDITKEDPAFVYAMLRPIIDSSSETQTNPSMVLDAEAVASIYQRVQDSGGKQDFNLLKSYKKEWDRIQQAGSEKTQTRGKTDGWIRIPSKRNDPEKFEKNVAKLMGYASGQGWCIAGHTYANQYLGGGDFWLLLDKGTAVVAIRMAGEVVAEIRGKNNQDPHYYAEETMSFLEEKGFALQDERDGYSAAQATYNSLKNGKEINEKFENDPEYRAAYIEKIKEYPHEYEMLYEKNRNIPEVRASLVEYWTNLLRMKPQDYSRCPQDIKDALSPEIEAEVAAWWTDQVESDIVKIDHYGFPRDLMARHENLASAVGRSYTNRIRVKPWEMASLEEEVIARVDPEVREIAKQDKTYQLFLELKACAQGEDDSLNPEEIANNAGWTTALLDTWEDGSFDYDDHDKDEIAFDEIWDDYLTDDGKLDFMTFEYYNDERRLEAVVEQIGSTWYAYVESDPKNYDEFENYDSNRYRDHYWDSHQIHEARDNAWRNAVAENPRRLNDLPNDLEYLYEEEDSTAYVEQWVTQVKSGAETFEDAYDFLDDYPEMQEEFFAVFTKDAESEKYIWETIVADPEFLYDNIVMLLEKTNIVWTHVDEIKKMIDDKIAEKPNRIVDLKADVIDTIEAEDDAFFSDEEMERYNQLYKNHHMQRIEETPWGFGEIDRRMQQDPDIIERYHNKEKWLEAVFNHGDEAVKRMPEHLKQDPDIVAAYEKHDILYKFRYPPARGAEDKLKAFAMYEKFDEILGRYRNDPEFREMAYARAVEGWLHIIAMTYDRNESFMFMGIPPIFMQDETILDATAKQYTSWFRSSGEIDVEKIHPEIAKRIDGAMITKVMETLSYARNPAELVSYMESAEEYRNHEKYPELYQSMKKSYINFLQDNYYSRTVSSALRLFPDIFASDPEVLEVARTALQKLEQEGYPNYGDYPEAVNRLASRKFNLAKRGQTMETKNDTGFENVQETFTIPAKVLSFFERKVEDLNKRAQKNSIPGIQYKVLGQETLPPNGNRAKEEIVYKIQVTGVIPRVDGWSFVATIAHAVDDSGQYSNIVSAIPSLEEDIPQKYWKQEPICEHCRTKRRRKDTFLLKNEDSGEYKQCGRNCLADFLRTGNAEDIVRASEILAINQELALLTSEDFDEYGGYGRRTRDVPLLNILALTHKVVSQIGYVKSTDYDNVPTKDAIFEIINYDGNDPERMIRDLGLTSVETGAEDYIVADEAIQWIKNLSEEEARGNSYLSNLKSLSNGAFVNRKFMGLVVSMIPTYLRQRDKIRREQTLDRMREESGDDNPYLGIIGDSLEFNVMIEKTKGPFRNGTSILYMGVTDKYKMVKWWGKPADLFEEGKTYAVIGTPISQEFDKYEKTETTELRDVVLASEAPPDTSDDPFIGTIENGKGKMENFEFVLVDQKGPFQSDYGYGYGAPQSYMIYIFQDSMGRKAKWSGPTDKYDVEIGGKYKVRAKPKEHTENDRYEKGPVTVLTNVRNIEELEASPEVENEHRARVENIVATPIPQTLPELEELWRNTERTLEALNGRYSELELMLNKKIQEIRMVLEGFAYEDFLKSKDATILFKAYVWNNLKRTPTDIENIYLDSVKTLYLDQAKIEELETKCQTLGASPDLPIESQQLCQFFAVLTTSARQFIAEAKGVYESDYKERYMGIYK